MESLELVTLKNLEFRTISNPDSLNIEVSHSYVFINYYFYHIYIFYDLLKDLDNRIIKVIIT